MRWPGSRIDRPFWTVTWPLLGVELAIIPHLKEECLSSLLIKKILNFCLEIAIFKHVFELCRRWPILLYILVCHSVTSHWISGYYNPIWRGYIGLSYDPNCFNIWPVVLAQKRNYVSKKEAPRIFCQSTLILDLLIHPVSIECPSKYPYAINGGLTCCHYLTYKHTYEHTAFLDPKEKCDDWWIDCPDQSRKCRTNDKPHGMAPQGCKLEQEMQKQNKEYEYAIQP